MTTILEYLRGDDKAVTYEGKSESRRIFHELVMHSALVVRAVFLEIYVLLIKENGHRCIRQRWRRGRGGGDNKTIR